MSDSPTVASPTVAELFELAGYGKFDGADIDEAVKWLFVERKWLSDLAYENQETEFHPDWSMLEATRGSLREHMAASKALHRRIDRLRQAALRYRRENREYDRLTDKLTLRCQDYRAEREAARDAVDVERARADEAERQRDAHAEREVAAQKALLEAEAGLQWQKEHTETLDKNWESVAELARAQRDAAEAHIAPVWKLVEDQREEIVKLKAALSQRNGQDNERTD